MCYRNIKVNQTKSNMVLCFSWGTLPTFKYSCWFSCSCTPPRTVVETSDLLQHSFFFQSSGVDTWPKSRRTKHWKTSWSVLCSAQLCVFNVLHNKIQMFLADFLLLFFYCDHLKYVHACFRFTVFLFSHFDWRSERSITWQRCFV